MVAEPGARFPRPTPAGGGGCGGERGERARPRDDFGVDHVAEFAGELEEGRHGYGASLFLFLFLFLFT